MALSPKEEMIKGLSEHEYYQQLDMHEKAEVVDAFLAEGFKPDQPAAKVILALKLHVAIFVKTASALWPLVQAMPEAVKLSGELNQIVKVHNEILAGDSVKSKYQGAARFGAVALALGCLLAGVLGTMGYYHWRGYPQAVTAQQVAELSAKIEHADNLAAYSGTGLPPNDLKRAAQILKRVDNSEIEALWKLIQNGNSLAGLTSGEPKILFDPNNNDRRFTTLNVWVEPARKR